MRIEKNGHSIRTLAEWEEHAGPKSRKHWKPGRSAYELARAWCRAEGPAMPADVRLLLDSRAETRGLAVDAVWPEHPIRFDKRFGEPRNADLAFVGTSAAGTVAVTIEAKADGAFGATVADTFVDALERNTETPRSQGIGRIEDLARALFAARDEEDAPRVGTLRYQLLTAAAGTLALAQRHGTDFAVLIVHEFRTDRPDEGRCAENALDLAAFVHRLQGQPVSPEALAASSLLGPFTVPGVPLFDGPREILIGKATTQLQAA